LKLNHEEYGSGRPLIILHGLFGSLDNWHSVSKGLRKRFRVFALDQRNHGRSPHSSGQEYRLMAEDLREFMSDHRIESAVLLGHSMGGKTAMQFALLHPGMVDKLIIVDILPGRYRSPDPGLIHSLERLLSLGKPSTLKEADAKMRPYIQDPALRNLLLKNLSRNENGCYEWRINLRTILDNFGRMSDGVSGEPYTKPCLFIRGGLSDHVPGDRWGEACDLFPSAKLITIPGAGHWVHAERPQEFLDAVLGFLQPASLQEGAAGNFEKTK
jgi:pimeloyl-ACP methyl ester carboxylesterase